MSEKIYIKATKRTPIPRSARLRESSNGGGGSSVTISGGGGSSTTIIGDTHTHTNLADLERLRVDAFDYLRIESFVENDGQLTAEMVKAKAGFSDNAAEATHAANSDKWDTHRFGDYLNQPVRSTDAVRFGEVEATRSVRTATADVAESARIGEVITTDIHNDTFSDDILGGCGFRIAVTPNGRAVVWCDDLNVRGDLNVARVVVNEVSAVGGRIIISAASAKVADVDPGEITDTTAVIRLSDEGSGAFIPGDLVRWATADFDGGTIHRRQGWWLVVDNAPANTLTIRKIDNSRITLSDIANLPAKGDALVQMGNLSDSSRQSIVVIASAVNSEGISVYTNVNTTHLPQPRVRLGNLNAITDSATSPSGWGLYAENAFIKGKFLINSLNSEIDGARLDELLTRILADQNGISLSVSSQSLEGEHRNLLLATNQGTTNWLIFGSGDVYEMHDFWRVADFWHTHKGKNQDYGVAFMALRRQQAADLNAYERLRYPVRSSLIADGRPLTLSFRIYFEGEVQPMSLRAVIADALGNEKGDDVMFDNILALQGTLVTLPLEVGQQIDDDVYVTIDIIDGRHQWERMMVWDLKLEPSATASDWSPAPEDSAQPYAEELQSEIAMLPDSISARVASEIDGDRRASGIEITPNGVTIDGDKVTVVNGNMTAALFENGAINAELLNVAKVVCVNADGQMTSALNRNGDGAFEIFYPTTSQPRLVTSPMDIVVDDEVVASVMRYYSEDGALLWWMSSNGMTVKQLPYYWEILRDLVALRVLQVKDFDRTARVSQRLSELSGARLADFYVFRSSSYDPAPIGGTYKSHDGEIHTSQNLSDDSLELTPILYSDEFWHQPPLAKPNGEVAQGYYWRWRYTHTDGALVVTKLQWGFHN